MKSDEIASFLLENYAGTTTVNAWGELSIFYNPGLHLPRGVYFATIKDKDGENDKASQLDREGVFRLNMGTPKSQFFEHFGAPPARPVKGGIVNGDWDFTAINKLTPHPVYGWMSWMSVNNPSEELFLSLSPLLDAAYKKSVTSFEKRRT